MSPRGSVILICSTGLVGLALLATGVTFGADAVSAGGQSAKSVPDTGCDRFASTNGDDGNRGTAARPFRTVERLVRVLKPGQTGCLRGGAYYGHIAFSRAGTKRKPIVLRSAPGTRATIRGRVWVSPEARHVVLQRLSIDGRYTIEIALQVAGDGFKLLDSEVTTGNQDRSCVLLIDGVKDVLLQGNRIHDCGVPGKNYHQHGIYIQDARGARIIRNLIYDNKSGWGIHFWTNGDDVLVANNVLDGNRGGITLGGNSTGVSERNTIRNNIITNNGTIDGVTSYWGSTPGTGNVVRDNCFWQNQAHNLSGMGYVASGSKVADPLYVDRSAKNFRLQPGSPCAGKAATRLH
jgi:hypothetical protein